MDAGESAGVRVNTFQDAQAELVDRTLDALKAAYDRGGMAAIRAADEACFAERALLESYFGETA